jgi:hypothetical protein
MARSLVLIALLALSGCTFRAGYGYPKIEEEASNEHPSKHVYCVFKGVEWTIAEEPMPPACAQMGEVVKAD